MTTHPLPHTPLIRRTDLLSQGLSDNVIRRARRAGMLANVAPGVYLSISEMGTLEPVARHRAMISALVPGLAGDPVVSHLSAAIAHGLTTSSDRTTALLPAPVHITRAGPIKSRRGPLLQVHRARLVPQEMVQFEGLMLTSVPRTVLDCALTVPFEAAVEMAISALNTGDVRAGHLTDQLRRHARTPGMRRAAAVLQTVGISLPP